VPASSIGPVDLRPGLTADEFRNEYANRKPVVIPGGAKRLAAACEWTLDSLRRAASGAVVQVKKTGDVAARGGRSPSSSWAGVPLPVLMPGLRSYFTYVS